MVSIHLTYTPSASFTHHTSHQLASSHLDPICLLPFVNLKTCCAFVAPPSPAISIAHLASQPAHTIKSVRVSWRLDTCPLLWPHTRSSFAHCTCILDTRPGVGAIGRRCVAGRWMCECVWTARFSRTCMYTLPWPPAPGSWG